MIKHHKCKNQWYHKVCKNKRGARKKAKIIQVIKYKDKNLKEAKKRRN
jgi:hypothetical protein